MKTKFTPGPWEVVQYGPMVGKIVGVGVRGVQTIARVDLQTSTIAEDDANARLIASAPELLAALQMMVDDYVTTPEHERTPFHEPAPSA